MSTFTILTVDPETRRWGDKNDMIAYRVSLSGEQGNGKSVELSRHEKAAPPRPDEVVDGELKEYPPHGWKLVKPKGAPRASGGSSGSFQRDPKEAARIVRQHSQEMAMLHVASMERRGKLPDGWDLPALVKVIDWYQADAEGAVPQ